MTSATAAVQPDVGLKPFSWRFTTPLLVGSALNAVNSSMIATALVPIAAGLHVPVGRTASLVTALYLASAIAQPTAGKVAEVFGARRVFLAGAALVLLGGVVGGLAPDLVTLLIARVLIGLSRSYLRYALIALCVYIVLYGITQWLEAARGMSALDAGLLLLPTSVISGVVVAPISRRNLVRGPVIAAAVASLVASAGVLVLTSGTGIVWIVLITLLFGVALGAAASGNQIALYTQAPPEQLGVASGLFRTFGYVGSIASSAITGIVFHRSVTDGGVHRIALIMIGVSAVALALSVLDRKLHSPGRP